MSENTSIDIVMTTIIIIINTGVNDIYSKLFTVLSAIFLHQNVARKNTDGSCIDEGKLSQWL